MNRIFSFYFLYFAPVHNRPGHRDPDSFSRPNRNETAKNPFQDARTYFWAGLNQRLRSVIETIWLCFASKHYGDQVFRTLEKPAVQILLSFHSESRNHAIFFPADHSNSWAVLICFACSVRTHPHSFRQRYSFMLARPEFFRYLSSRLFSRHHNLDLSQSDVQAIKTGRKAQKMVNTKNTEPGTLAIIIRIL